MSQIGRTIKALASVAVATAAAWLAGPALARAADYGGASSSIV